MKLQPFLSEFTNGSWLIIGLSYIILILLITFIVYILEQLNIEKVSENQHRFLFAFSKALSICLRAFIGKGSATGLKSQTYKFIVFSLTMLGFIVLCHYRAQMNAALNVDIKTFPINSWKELDKSNYKVLLLIGSIIEDKFKYAPSGSTLKNIYDEKIAVIPDHEQRGAIGTKGSIDKVMSGGYIIYGSFEVFQRSNDYPCNIIEIKSFQ